MNEQPSSRPAPLCPVHRHPMKRTGFKDGRELFRCIDDECQCKSDRPLTNEPSSPSPRQPAAE